MDDHTLHHLCKALHSADTAWQAAATTGADDITQICNTIYTLQYHAQPHAKSPPPGTLSSMLTEARQRLQHLHATLRRLRSVISGIERWRAELSTSKLSKFVDEFLIGVREDVAQKKNVVDNLKEAENGGDVDVHRWLAVWSECTERVGRPDAQFIQSFVEAEATLVADALCPTPTKEIAGKATDVKQLSPALAMLKKKSLGK